MPTTPYDLKHPHLEPVPPSPEPYMIPPCDYGPSTPVAPDWGHSGDDAQADFGWNPNCGGTWPRSPRRRTTRLLRRKPSTCHCPLRAKFRRLRNPLRARLQAPSYSPGRWFADQASLDSLNLAPRPNDWRADYTPPHVPRNISWCLSRGMQMPAKFPAEVPYALSPLIQYTSPSTYPLRYDIRDNPSETDIQFLNLLRPSNDIDFYQLATSPAVNELCLSHPRLPWYIHVCASQPNGITIGDVLTQIHESLSKPINQRDFYNVDMTASDREEMSTAFYHRRGEDTGRGMLRMDFLGSNVTFLGLAKTKHGVWEIKTSDAMH
ncbi:hypothetical protein FPV67DRAFT_890158 [Lyophyllum atratum]|nr:hypothetical protein FPV67DRAFT_890158 [Lyophyllum atratum]